MRVKLCAKYCKVRDMQNKWAFICLQNRLFSETLLGEILSCLKRAAKNASTNGGDAFRVGKMPCPCPK